MATRATCSSVLALAVALACSSCVLVAETDFPPGVELQGGPRFDRLRVEGFEVGVTAEVGTAVSTTLASAYGGGVFASGASTTATRIYSNTASDLVADLAADYLENVGISRVVERRGNAGAGTPDLILKATMHQEGSWGNAWSIPFDTLMVLGVVLPITWANESSCSLRVYSGDGEFLKAYTSGLHAVRTWYYWPGPVRIDASNERILVGGAHASREVLDMFVHDASVGAFANAKGSHSAKGSDAVPTAPAHP